MFRNSELWMFSCQVRNQSVEKGSWPFEGDLPAISLYSRIRRSYDSVVSDSSTCMRAPIWISMAARSICLDSFSTLLAGALAAGALVDMAGFRWRLGVEGCGQMRQSTSDTRLAIRMLACSVLVASLPTFLAEWLVSKLHTRLSSTRKLQRSVLREASFITCAGDSDARMSADSSFMHKRNTASALSRRIRVWANI